MKNSNILLIIITVIILIIIIVLIVTRKDEYSNKILNLDFPLKLQYSDGHMSNGLIYTSIASCDMKTCVCLGTGSGFVPLMMYEGQKLNKINDIECYIVDLGHDLDNEEHSKWGYSEDFKQSIFNPNSEFRIKYPQIKILNMSTDDALKYFIDNNIKIDYLHIDADHSHHQSFKDFENYLKIMNKDFVITLHDTAIGHLDNHLDGCVPKTISLIREKYCKNNNQYEIIDFNLKDKYGVGTSIFKPRINSKFDDKEIKQIKEIEKKVKVKRYTDSEYIKWPYLFEDNFNIRQIIIASHFTNNNIKNVIEIGGWLTPVKDWLNKYVNYTNIDPYKMNVNDYNLINKKIDDISDEEINNIINKNKEKLGIVLLGIDYEFSDKIKKMFNNADIIGLESSCNWKYGYEQMNKMIKFLETNFQTVINTKLECETKNTNYNLRHLIILKKIK